MCTRTSINALVPEMRKFTFLLGALMLLNCSGDDLSPEDNSYEFIQPVNFPDAVYTFENNPVTKEGFELGRALFYDPILSADSTVACANCHQQARSFSDPVHRFSKGVNETSGFRNAPAIHNMAFQSSFFWDGGVRHLDFVPINAITSEIEMHESMEHVVGKLKRSARYQSRFIDAFGSPDIDSQKMLHALSQFMAMMVSSNSRYDKYIRNEGEAITVGEFRGLQLFRSKCASCHATDLFTDGSFRNNGLDSSFEKDSGRARITENSGDIGKFKVPGLRNSELTYPYMHDGRFKTLEEVLDHYAGGIMDSPTLDPILKKDASLGIPLTEAEKEDIILFIKTLTDKEFLNDRRFSQPSN